jgi:hypothetical protein
MRGQQLGWRLFAGLMSWLFIDGLMQGRTKPVAYPWLDYVGYPIEFLALAGLIIYAFALPRGRSHFWRIIVLIYPIWVLLSIALMFIRRPAMHHENLRTLGYIGAIVIVLFMAIPTWIALRRLQSTSVG